MTFRVKGKRKKRASGAQRVEMGTLTSVHLLARPAIIPRADIWGYVSPLGSRARAIPPRSFGKDALLGGGRPLLEPCCPLLASWAPQPAPVVICQYTVIRDEARLIKIAACPEMELPFGRV